MTQPDITDTDAPPGTPFDPELHDARDPGPEVRVYVSRNGRGQTDNLHLRPDCRGLRQVETVRPVRRGVLWDDVPTCDYCVALVTDGSHPSTNGGGDRGHLDALERAAEEGQG